MDLSDFLSPSVVFALFAGIFFLHRAWKPKVWQATMGVTSSSSIHEESSVSKESDFPSDWWKGSGTFELERRGIFSKTWLYIAHRSQFIKPGDYKSYELAGFRIFLILGKDNQMRAFHNVCRHRAYTVTRKESGSTPVLGCKYHGWSYNTVGELVKAPQFENVPGFDKAQNSLFGIHTQVSRSGFIFLNLDAGPTASDAETGALDGFAERNRLGRVSWAAGETLDGAFGWKFGLRLEQYVDTAELDTRISQSSNVGLATRVSRYIRARDSEDIALFPNVSFHTVKGTEWLYSLTVLPISEQKASVRYDLHRGQAEENSDGETASKHLRDLLSEAIQALEKEYQSQLNRPVQEIGAEHAETQNQILDYVKAHSKLERAVGSEVFPAMRQPRQSQRFELADKLCKELNCQSAADSGENTLSNGILAW